ncbi:DUF6807 family protein [Robiginitalea sp. SC105]|uniref:DUF6807 family protein n=1 Tax=Robiginitalea sp. SC105 TaxID=2762332 RepID=UPI0016394DD2|nr:DUF6807 family protein [Robiginitalea sp. SC105]MBC2840273.1 PmoA family protein [Robiginitalea sp. SC105]
MFRIYGFLLIFGIAVPACSQQVSVDIRPGAAYFTEGADSILTYQIAEKSLDGAYGRANYIHPLFGLDGQVLSEDFPADHLHHRGIFWAWHQLYIDGKRIGDGWEIRDFSWEVKSVQEIGNQRNTGALPGGARAIQAEVLWKSPLWTDPRGRELPLVREITRITAYPAKDAYRQIDVVISLIALEEGMRIGGSEDEKGYGGFSARIRLADGMAFTGPNGKVVPENLPVQAVGWLDISGPIGRGGADSGLTILSHPGNPGYPNPWILRASGSMQNAVYPHPGATAVPLSTTQPLILSYRLLVHKGNSRALDISKLHAGYSRTAY